MKQIPRHLKIFLSGFFLAAFTLHPILHAAYEEEISLRGAEREETRFLDPFAATGSALTYLPRKILDGSLYLTGHTAAKLSDKDFIEKVKDILYIYERKLLWYPVVEYASGFRPAYGAGLLYKDEGLRISAKAMAHDSNYWSYSVKPSYLTYTPLGEWRNSVLAVVEKKNDRRFYGIGADPRNDHRSAFVGQNDYGVYTETRKKIQWESSLYKPDRSLGLTYLGYYQRRSFDDHGYGINDVREVFNHSLIPGFDAPVKQLYNELALEIDTRDQKKILAPGFRSELYSGISAGFGKHDANLFRTGFDVAGFIPVVKEDRLFVPRVTADLVENINDKPIPFSEYPRHHTFRGVSSREIIRSERVSIVPSIEYQWPLSHMFSGHVFLDSLFVGPRAEGIRWHEGLWATGFGVDFHLFKNELARAEMAFGSEGFQAMITIGAPLKTNHRKDW
jgi:hypothetical protein